MLRFEPSDSFSVEFEGLYRDKIIRRLRQSGDVPAFQLRTLAVVFAPGKALNVRLGRQEIRVGNGLVLDDFFDAAVVDFFGRRIRSRRRSRIPRPPGGPGNPGLSEGIFLFIKKSCWKGTCGASYGDFALAFASVSRRLGEGFHLRCTEKIFAANGSYDAEIISLFGQAQASLRFPDVRRSRGPAVCGFKGDGFWSPFGLRSWRFSGAGSVQVKFHALYGSGGDRTYFSRPLGPFPWPSGCIIPSARGHRPLGAESIFTPNS